MKFKVGDKVRSIHLLIATGQVGTVTLIDEGMPEWPVHVNFGPKNGGMYMGEEELELVDEKDNENA